MIGLNRNNYQSWLVDEIDYPYSGSIKDQIIFILNYAILAPSTFNAQPWKVELSANTVSLYLDRSRMLETANRDGRFAYITMGCFLENLILASNFFGWEPSIKFDIRKEEQFIHVAEVYYKERDKKKDLYNLFKVIKDRATNRSIYTEKSLSDKIIRLIKSFSTKSCHILVLEKEIRNAIATISKEADMEVWGDDNKRLEHSQWVRTNLTFKYDGMPAFGVGMGLLPSLFAKKVMQSPLFPKMQATKNVQAIMNTKDFIVILGKDSELAWIEVGMLYEKLALFLTKEHIALSPMGTLIESSKSREILSSLVSNNTNLLPQLFFRVGYAIKDVPHSPRIPVKKIFK